MYVCLCLCVYACACKQRLFLCGSLWSLQEVSALIREAVDQRVKQFLESRQQQHRGPQVKLSREMTPANPLCVKGTPPHPTSHTNTCQAKSQFTGPQQPAHTTGTIQLDAKILKTRIDSIGNDMFR